MIKNDQKIIQKDANERKGAWNKWIETFDIKINKKKKIKRKKKAQKKIERINENSFSSFVFFYYQQKIHHQTKTTTTQKKGKTKGITKKKMETNVFHSFEFQTIVFGIIIKKNKMK